MLIILFAIILMAALIPQLWVKSVMRANSKEIDNMPGTGAELAEHLLKRFNMEGYKVEETDDMKDHFSPMEKTVRLGHKNFHGKSLTAIAVAAHEVGHAIQHHKNEPIFQLRGKYIPLATMLTETGLWILRLLPIVAILVKSPPLIFVLVGASLLFQFLGALSYLIILPEEWDASFNKALPILKEGNYAPESELPHIEKVLKAAALTYFAGALASILNLARLFMLFRR